MEDLTAQLDRGGHWRKDDTMSDQTKNAQPSPSEKMPGNPDGIEDIDDIEEREDRVEEADRRQAGGRPFESDESGSPDSRRGSARKS